MDVIMGFVHAFSLKSGDFFFMWSMLLMLALGSAIVVERWFYLTIRANVDAPKFMGKIFSLVKANQIDAAIDLCKKAPTAALPRVTKVGLEKASTTQRAIQNAMDETTLEIIPTLEKRTGWLNMLANVATMVGLMGTIFGLIVSFKAVGAAGIDPAEKSAMLSSGIATSLNCTFFGLLIAITFSITFTWLTQKTTKLVDEIDEFSVKLINLLGSN